MERTLLLDIFFDLVLLASAILENGLSVRFVDKLVFEGDRVLSRRQKGWIWAAVGLASLLEFINKEMGFFYSLNMLGLQIIIVDTALLVIRRKKFISITCVFIMFFSIVQTIEILVVIGISTKILGAKNMLAVYGADFPYLRNAILLMIRLAVWGVYRVIRMSEVRINHPMLLGGASVLAYIDMYYLFIYAYMGQNFVNIRTSVVAMSVIILILAVLIICSLYYAQRERNAELKQKDLALEENYTRFYNVYSENKYLSHDLKNHLNILENYMRHKEYEKAYNYMIKLREPILKIEEYAPSGNQIVDMILNDKFAIAEKENISVNQEIDIIGEIGISDEDLCTVLSNLLDNALEACEKCIDQRSWIDITIRKMNYGLILKVSNSMQGKILISEERYLTTKEDSKRHGIGLDSVNYVLKKYNANIKIESSNQTFNVSIVFFL